MDFSVDPDVFEKHPDLAIGVIIATEIDNTKESSEIADSLHLAEEHVRNTLDIENFKENPNIASLQEVHRSFGSNPNKYPPSAQALVKRVLKGGELPSINPIVDLYNIISLRYIVCAGAEDLDVCEGNIRLAYAEGSESFLPLGLPAVASAKAGEEEEDPPSEGELVYKDDVGVICRKLNWREGDRTKITDGTKNAVIVIEGFAPFSKEDLDRAVKELSELIQEHCNAQIRIETLTKDNPSCTAK